MGRGLGGRRRLAAESGAHGSLRQQRCCHIPASTHCGIRMPPPFLPLHRLRRSGLARPWPASRPSSRPPTSPARPSQSLRRRISSVLEIAPSSTAALSCSDPLDSFDLLCAAITTRPGSLKGCTSPAQTVHRSSKLVAVQLAAGGPSEKAGALAGGVVPASSVHTWQTAPGINRRRPQAAPQS